MNDNNHYSSRIGAILTMIGVAVGLGNVWRFPYMMGTYGGSAFLLIYLVFTLLLAFPALLTEMMLGKNNPKGTISAYQSIFGTKGGKIIGLLLILSVTIAGSYYTVVVANVFFSAFFGLIWGFSDTNKALYQNQLGNANLQYILSILLIIIALFVSYKGLKKGIERVSKLIMPFFFLSIIYMIIHAWMMPGAIREVKNFLAPDWSAIGSTEVFAALGQAFYSLGLGGTFVVVYSSFISSNAEIPRIAILTSLGDLGSSLLASLFLVPAILVLGIQMNVGPSLIFETLPELFTVLPGGRWIGPLFLIALSLVAFLSLVAAFQVPISTLSGTKISSKKIIIGFGILQIILCLPSTYYPPLIGILDMIFGSGMQVFGSMMAMMGMWWGYKKGFYHKVLFPSTNKKGARLALIWLRWIVPATLLAVLIGYIYSNF